MTTRNFEDIIRERILAITLGEAQANEKTLAIDKNDIEIYASMIYALMRAGARREGPEAFREAFMHFAAGDRWQAASEEELQMIRGALLAAMDRFGMEAHALHVYFEAIDKGAMSEEEATQKALEVLSPES